MNQSQPCPIPPAASQAVRQATALVSKLVPTRGPWHSPGMKQTSSPMICPCSDVIKYGYGTFGYIFEILTNITEKVRQRDVMANAGSRDIVARRGQRLKFPLKITSDMSDAQNNTDKSVIFV